MISLSDRIESLKVWLVRKHLAYCEEEASRLREWLMERQETELQVKMSQFFEIPSLKKRMNNRDE